MPDLSKPIPTSAADPPFHVEPAPDGNGVDIALPSDRPKSAWVPFLALLIVTLIFAGGLLSWENNSAFMLCPFGLLLLWTFLYEVLVEHRWVVGPGRVGYRTTIRALNWSRLKLFGAPMQFEKVHERWSDGEGSNYRLLFHHDRKRPMEVVIEHDGKLIDALGEFMSQRSGFSLISSERVVAPPSLD